MQPEAEAKAVAVAETVAAVAELWLLWPSIELRFED
jgi:hypothetical protein